jgi:hypothetical protein
MEFSLEFHCALHILLNTLQDFLLSPDFPLVHNFISLEPNGVHSSQLPSRVSHIKSADHS